MSNQIKKREAVIAFFDAMGDAPKNPFLLNEYMFKIMGDIYDSAYEEGKKEGERNKIKKLCN